MNLDDVNDFDELVGFLSQVTMHHIRNQNEDVTVTADSEKDLEPESSESREIQTEIYRCIVRGDETHLPFLNQHRNLLDKVIVIECRPGCSCARLFEQHPLNMDDAEDERLEQVLSWIRLGICACLQGGINHPVPRRIAKNFVHVAAVLGNLEMLKFLAEAGCNLDRTTTANRFTPLFLAVMKNQESLVSYLLSHNCNVNTFSKVDKHSPLMEALLAKNTSIVDMLLSVPNIDVNTTNFRRESALIVTTRMESVEYVEKLLNAGADADFRDVRGATALTHATRLGFVDIAKCLLAKGASVDVPDTRGETSLHFAVYREELEMVDLLLQAGANPSHIPEDGFPAIVVAAYSNSWEIIELLLSHDADITSSNNHSYTALHIAAWNGHLESVQLLLEHGAPHDIKTVDKNTPLSLAAHGRHPEIIQALLPYGCDVNNSDKDKDTPLLYATYNGDEESVRKLIEFGSDPNIRNRVNVTALWNAVYSRNISIIKILLAANVDLDVPSVGINQHSPSDEAVFIYTTPRTPLWVAAERNDPEIVLLLISAGYDLSKEKWIPDTLPEPVVNNVALQNLLIHYKTTSPRLVALCRNVFRKRFGKNVNQCTESLEIPQVLKKYIMLKDILG